MRAGRIVGAGLLLGLGLVATQASPSLAQAACTGDNTIQQAPYSCTGSRDFGGGLVVSVLLAVDATGRAVADYTLAEPVETATPIAMHSWIGDDTGPDIIVTGSIAAGQTTGQLVIDQIRCGQVDVKAVDITPGAPAGEIVGPYVTWGDNCQQAPTTTTTTVAPTTVGPTTTGAVSPTSAVRPTGAASTLPTSGGEARQPVAVGLVALAAGACLLLAARRWRHS